MDQNEDTTSPQGDEQNDSAQSTVTVVCNGATCYCSLSVANNSAATAVPLTVTSQSRVDVNGGKAVATEKDNALANVNFNQCQPPGSSNPLPCHTQIKWDKMYEEVVINGDRLKILVEDSIGTCNANGAPGQVKIAKHGQQAQQIVRWHMENVDVYSMQKQFPFYRHTPPPNEELPMVSTVSCVTLDKTYDSTGPKSTTVTAIKVRPGQRLKFTVKRYSNKKAFNKNRTCWKIWDGFGFSRPKEIFENHGAEFEIDVEQPGKYRVLAYGTLNVEKQNSPGCSIDVEVVKNKIVAIEGDSKAAINNAATYTLKPALADWQQADGEIKWYIKHAVNGMEEEGSDTTITHSFKYIGAYTITVYVDHELAVTKSITVGYNEIAGVSIAGSNSTGTYKIRPGQPVQIQGRYKFTASDADISNLRWRYKPPMGPDVDYAAAAGKQSFTPAPALATKGAHLFEAYRKDGQRYNLKGDDTISIQVVENTVKQLTWRQNNLKLGREMTFTISEMEFPDLSPAELSNTWWLLSGPEPANAKRTKEFRHRFTKAGTYTLSCAIGTTTPKTVSFTVAAPEITAAFWCDAHGSKLKSAGWGQEVNICFKTKGLDGENLVLDIYDTDWNGDNIVAGSTVTFGGDSNGVLKPQTLTNAIRTNVKAHGASEDGELYVKLRVASNDLIVKGIDQKWAKQLYVNDKKKVLNCIVGTADGKKRHVMVDVNETSTVYVQTQGYIGKELEMRLRERVIGPDPEFKPARKKMKVEQDGVVRFPLQWSVAKQDGQRKARKFYVEIWDGDDKIWDGDAWGNGSLMVQMMPGTKIETAEGMEGVAVVEKVNGPAIKTNTCPRCKGDITKDLVKQVYVDATDELCQSLANELNKVYTIKDAKGREVQKKLYEIFELNTCARKAHFFAQSMQESGSTLRAAMNGENMNYSVEGLLHTGFQNVSERRDGTDLARKLGRKTENGILSLEEQIKVANFVYGLNPKAGDLGNNPPTDNLSLESKNNEGWRFRGRGLLQITGRHNYKKIQDTIESLLQSKVVDIKEGREDESGFTIKEAVLTGLADWHKDKMYAAADTGVDPAAVDKVINIINSKTKSRAERKEHFKKTKQVFKTDWCHHLPSDKPYVTSDMFTYRVYHDYRIELHIPLNIKEGFEKKFKYLYIDSSGKEHEVCIVDWFEIDEMKKREGDIFSIPKGCIPAKTKTFDIEGVNQKSVYYYNDGSIVAQGKKGEGAGTLVLKFIRTGRKAMLIKMTDPLNLKSPSETFLIKYEFRETIRKYMGPNHFAAFIGALAECSYADIICKGAAFEDGTCFPSVAHVNGQSVDTDYLDHQKEQEFINALYSFGFTNNLNAIGMSYNNSKVDNKGGHQGHMHAGAQSIKISICKENEK